MSDRLFSYCMRILAVVYIASAVTACAGIWWAYPELRGLMIAISAAGIVGRVAWREARDA